MEAAVGATAESRVGQSSSKTIESGRGEILAIGVRLAELSGVIVQPALHNLSVTDDGFTYAISCDCGLDVVRDAHVFEVPEKSPRLREAAS